MKEFDCNGFLQDLVVELLEMTKDPTIYNQNDPFCSGYRSALYSTIHLIEEQSKVWELEPRELGLGDFSADDWRRMGIDYWKMKGGSL